MIVALTSPGQMGVGLGRVLVRNGATVLVQLEGRSDASRARALEAGLTPVSGDDAFRDADLLLSLSPPGIARDLAERFAATLSHGTPAPVYLDANAVSPDTARHMAAQLEKAGLVFCDGGVIGLPPGTAPKDPTLFVSGPNTAAAERLADFGLNVKRVDGRVGSASAVKMCYAGITKGLIALGSAMIANAEREGVGAVLAAELGNSQTALLTGFTRSVPDMFGKAGRWVAEMGEIAATCPPDSPERDVYVQLAAFYADMAESDSESRITAIERFFRQARES